MMAVKVARETPSSQNPLTGSACLPLAALQFAPGGSYGQGQIIAYWLLLLHQSVLEA